MTPPEHQETLVEVNHLKKYFPIKRGFFSKVQGYVKAVDDVSFVIRKGETMGLVGESGCGKTTTGRTLLRALEPTSGEFWFEDANLGRVNVAELDEQKLKIARRNIQMIFQDPYSSLNPRMNLLQLIGEPLHIHNIARGEALRAAG